MFLDVINGTYQPHAELLFLASLQVTTRPLIRESLDGTPRLFFSGDEQVDVQRDITTANEDFSVSGNDQGDSPTAHDGTVSGSTTGFTTADEDFFFSGDDQWVSPAAHDGIFSGSTTGFGTAYDSGIVRRDTMPIASGDDLRDTPTAHEVIVSGSATRFGTAYDSGTVTRDTSRIVSGSDQRDSPTACGLIVSGSITGIDTAYDSGIVGRDIAPIVSGDDQRDFPTAHTRLLFLETIHDPATAHRDAIANFGTRVMHWASPYNGT